jgi:CRISPR-associated endonuclease/helicase Cas3
LALAEPNLDSWNDGHDPDLALHLIASHHGYARPWAPLCIDQSPIEVSLQQIGLDISLTPEQRLACVYHRIDSSVAPRFWRLTRKYGWWGLAMLEAVLRLSDHRVSQKESQMQSKQAKRDLPQNQEASV